MLNVNIEVGEREITQRMYFCQKVNLSTITYDMRFSPTHLPDIYKEDPTALTLVDRLYCFTIRKSFNYITK